MSDLDSVEPCCYERFKSLASATFGRVSPDCKGTSLVRHRDRILDCEDFLLHESAAAATKIAHECIAKIVNRSASDHGAGDVRPAHGAAVRLQKNFVERDRYAERVQLVDDFLRARE